MNNLIKEFLRKDYVFAVVGVSRNPEKYGYKVYLDLKKAGYSVYPVNPSTREIDGDKCYPSLSELPVKADVVNIIVPPEITEKVIKECVKLGVKRVWMQPGSESKKAIYLCDKSRIKAVYGVCVMMEGNKINSGRT